MDGVRQRYAQHLRSSDLTESIRFGKAFQLHGIRLLTRRGSCFLVCRLTWPPMSAGKTCERFAEIHRVVAQARVNPHPAQVGVQRHPPLRKQAAYRLPRIKIQVDIMRRPSLTIEGMDAGCHGGHAAWPVARRREDGGHSEMFGVGFCRKSSDSMRMPGQCRRQSARSPCNHDAYYTE